MGKVVKKTVRSTSESTKKQRRWRSGTVAKREIKRLQKGVDLLIRRAPFRRLIAEIGNDYKEGFRMRESAKKALQHAAEAYLIDYFVAGNVVATEATGKPVLTLKPRHTRAANNAALRFPGKPHDYSFAERRAAARHRERYEQRKAKQSEKKERKSEKKEKKSGSSSTTKETAEQPTSLLGQLVAGM